MVVRRGLDAYRNTEKQTEIHPVKLIHMLYERVLTHLEEAEIGIKENNPKKRGENLSKSIAIVTELNASLKSEDESDAARFLRGLYTAILVELPKVSLSGDIQILRQSARYMKQLKEVWEQTAMKEHGLDVARSMEVPPAPAESVESNQYASSPRSGLLSAFNASV